MKEEWMDDLDRDLDSACDRYYCYVSGPYTSDPEGNVLRAIVASNELRKKGVIPFCPHLTHFMHKLEPDTYEAWMDYDCAWLSKCNSVLRLEGESAGAEREVALANLLSKKVCSSIEEVLQHMQKFEEERKRVEMLICERRSHLEATI